MSRSVAFLNGTLWTGTGASAEALLIEDGRVAAIGSREAVERAIPTGAERIDLHGRLAIPGLIDAHLHLGDLTRRREGVDLRGSATVDEIVARAHAWAVRRPGGPIYGGGWDQERFGRYPDRHDLDRISMDRFVLLERICGHAAVLNTRGLDELGLEGRGSDPPGGRVGRDPTGRANGLLFDRAFSPARAFLERESPVRAEDALRTLSFAASFGLTTVASMSVGAEELATASEIPARGEPPVRMRLFVHPERLGRPLPEPSRDSDPAVAVAGLKLVTDGSLGAHTAWLEEPYEDRPDERGLSLWSSAELDEQILRAAHQKLPVALHAIGDRALRNCLEALAKRHHYGTPRIEHAAMTPPTLWDRLAAVRPTLVVQPHFVVSDTWLVERLGEERARWTYAFRTLRARGLHLVGSSDAPIEPLDPFSGIRAAISARGGSGASESLSAEEALGLYTSEAGTAVGDPSLGRLAVDSPGDLVVLGAPTLAMALSIDAPVRETWRAGRRTFIAADAGTRGPGLSDEFGTSR